MRYLAIALLLALQGCAAKESEQTATAVAQPVTAVCECFHNASGQFLDRLITQADCTTLQSAVLVQCSGCVLRAHVTCPYLYL